MTSGGNGASSGVEYLNNSTGDVDVRNNLWIKNTQNPPRFSLPPGSTEDYNSCFNDDCSNLGGSHDVKIPTGAINPFVSDVLGNFHLLGDSAPGLALGFGLPAPYNTDFDGNPFGVGGNWDRGAFTFLVGAKPNPPQITSAVVQ
jgi:hypothetical protein